MEWASSFHHHLIIFYPLTARVVRAPHTISQSISVGLCQKHKPQHPDRVRVSMREHVKREKIPRLGISVTTTTEWLDCFACLCLRLAVTTHWRGFKIRRQASQPGDSAGRTTDTRYQRLHSHTSNTHAQSSSARAVPYMAKPRDARTNRQHGFIRRVFRLRRSFGGVLPLVLMQQRWRVKKRPTKE